MDSSITIAFGIMYFIPTIIAAYRKHRGGKSILLVNLALGWTLIGWFICLVWSVNGNVDEGLR